MNVGHLNLEFAIVERVAEVCDIGVEPVGNRIRKRTQEIARISDRARKELPQDGIERKRRAKHHQYDPSGLCPEPKRNKRVGIVLGSLSETAQIYD